MNASPEKITTWSPLRRPVFRALWIATVVSNIGTWMQGTASAWLMTSLTSSTLMVALVQTSTTLPVLLLALPAGAFADVFNRRKLLLFTQGWMLTAAAALGWLTLSGLTTPWLLLILTLILGLGAAMNAPSWQAIIPELVSPPEIPSAVALNSTGFNVSRSVGPALGGLILGAFGAGVAFLMNAASFLGVMAVIFLWRQSPRASSLPTEHIIGATRTGIRYVRHDPALRAVLIRVLSFITCASALMALLPLVARRELGLSAAGYGYLLGFFGAGAVAGAVILQGMRQRFSANLLIALGTLVFAAVLTVVAYIPIFFVVCSALVAAGAAWLALISSFNSSVQTLVPSWVRGRALSMYMLVLFGGIAAGSALWGTVATFLGLPLALTAAAGMLLVGLAATSSSRLPDVTTLDLSPSMHWPAPAVAVQPHPDKGPVLIMIEYLIDAAQSHPFKLAMKSMRSFRLREGAMGWRLFVDAAEPRRYLESFMVESWIEHLRQHERVTVADREMEKMVHAFHTGSEPPIVTHLLGESLPKDRERSV
jgi:MFS family permease